jgi:hypothetical protein
MAGVTTVNLRCLIISPERVLYALNFPFRVYSRASLMKLRCTSPYVLQPVLPFLSWDPLSDLERYIRLSYTSTA